MFTLKLIKRDTILLINTTKGDLNCLIRELLRK